MRRVLLLAAAAAGLLLGSCLAVVDPPAEAYTLGVTVSGDAGTGVSVTVTDETAGAVLTSSGPVTSLPSTTQHAGLFTAGTPSIVSVQVDATGVPAAGSLLITVTIADESYDPPVTLTLDEYTLINGASAAADLRYLELFVLSPPPQ